MFKWKLERKVAGGGRAQIGRKLRGSQLYDGAAHTRKPISMEMQIEVRCQLFCYLRVDVFAFHKSI